MKRILRGFFEIRVINQILRRILYRIDTTITNRFYLELLFYRITGYWPNIDDPKSFNEKLQFLKLYDHKKVYQIMADKYRAKRYIEKRVGKDYVVPTICKWDNVKEISVDNLPDSFVIKTNHDSGGVVVCGNKSDCDINSIKRIIKRSLKTNYWLKGREWAYKYIKPVVFAEKYLDSDLMDYKLMCFNGKVKCLFVCSERNSLDGLKVTFYDTDWNILDFERHYPKSKSTIEKPKELREMIYVAEKLSQDIAFLRVDFYIVNDHPYVGEMTFYPGNGTEEFKPIEWDYKLGGWIDLSKVKK